MRSSPSLLVSFSLFFFNDTATTEIYTLSLHDALPIFSSSSFCRSATFFSRSVTRDCDSLSARSRATRSSSRERALKESQSRSEEHTSELQSPDHLVCRLLLEKKKGQT